MSAMRMLRRLFLLATLVSAVASATPFTLTIGVAQSGFSGIMPVDPACPSYAAAPTCVANANLQLFPITPTNGLDFTSDPNYRKVWNINGMTLTFTMTGLDTSVAPFLNSERIWFSGAGTGVSANGFNSGVATRTFTIPAGNQAFAQIANTLRSTGKLTAQLRNWANEVGPGTLSLPSAALAGVTINADTPEPSTMAACGIGFGAIFLLAFRRKR
jgi:hypothetical protein